MDHIFVYLEYTGLDKERFDEAVKNLPDDLSARVMTSREQWLYQGKDEGLAEERERSLVKTILNAFDNGVNLATIRAITSESEEKINAILKQHNRISSMKTT